MPLNQPVLSGPGAGRAVSYGSGSSAELKLAGEQARLLITLEPAGAE
jgi:hypothetical protein